MEIELKPGKYVVAVSGGVDSMALLSLLVEHAKRVESRKLKVKSTVNSTFHLPFSTFHFTIAHFDHGIRPDSAADRELVERTAKRLEISFKADFGRLGPGVSEAIARQARYDFLHRIKAETGADAIITAHHQDDVLETAVINLLRGTNRRGLTSLKNTNGIIRPLLNYSKQDLIDYAEQQNLEWREDSTNTDDNYLRNYVRHNILPAFNEADRQKLLRLIGDLRVTNEVLDTLLSSLGQNRVIDRQWFINLPHDVAKEQIVAWLRAHQIGNYDKKTVDRLTIAAKTARPGAKVDIINRWQMTVGKTGLALEHTER